MRLHNKTYSRGCSWWWTVSKAVSPSESVTSGRRCLASQKGNGDAQILDLKRLSGRCRRLPWHLAIHIIHLDLGHKPLPSHARSPLCLSEMIDLEGRLTDSFRSKTLRWFSEEYYGAPLNAE